MGDLKLLLSAWSVRDSLYKSVCSSSSGNVMIHLGIEMNPELNIAVSN